MSSEKEATSKKADPRPPCQVCRKERRRCEPGCTFAPYFPPHDNPARYNAVHQIFGYSHVDNLLAGTPPERRQDAVDTLVRTAREELERRLQMTMEEYGALLQNAPQPPPLQPVLPMAQAQQLAAGTGPRDTLMVQHPAAAQQQQQLAARGLNLILPLVQHQYQQMQMAQYAAAPGNAPQPPPLQTVLPMAQAQQLAAGTSPQDTLMMQHHAAAQQQLAARGLDLTLPLVQHQYQQMMLQMQMAHYAAAPGNAGQVPPLQTVLPMAQAQQLAAGTWPRDTLMVQHHAAAQHQQQQLAARGLNLTLPLVQHQYQQMMLQMQMPQYAAAPGNAGQLPPLQTVLPMAQLAAGTAPQDTLMMQCPAAAQQQLTATRLDLTLPPEQHDHQAAMRDNGKGKAVVTWDHHDELRLQRAVAAREKALLRQAAELGNWRQFPPVQTVRPVAQAQQLGAGTSPRDMLMTQHPAAAQQQQLTATGLDLTTVDQIAEAMLQGEIDVRMQQAEVVMGAAPGSSSGGTAAAFQPPVTADADPFLVQQQPQDDALGLQMDPPLPPLPPALGQQGNDQVPNQQDMDAGDADDLSSVLRTGC